MARACRGCLGWAEQENWRSLLALCTVHNYRVMTGLLGEERTLP